MRQAELDAVRASMYHAAWIGDVGEDNVKEMSGVKAYGAELITTSCTTACNSTVAWATCEKPRSSE
jgi:hypothetical protein